MLGIAGYLAGDAIDVEQTSPSCSCFIRSLNVFNRSNVNAVRAL